MSEPLSPVRLLDDDAPSNGSPRSSPTHRRPIVFAVAIAILLLVGAWFVDRAIARAAHLAVRGQVTLVIEESRRELGLLERPANEQDLTQLLARYERDGARYIAVIRIREDDGGAALGPAAGHAIGSGLDHGPPRRVGNRVRVVVPAVLESEAPIVLEVETLAANDIFLAGKLSLGVVVVVDALTIALGILFSRSLRTRERMVARLEAERRFVALGEMSAVLAHELKNPLTSLKGHAQLLAEVLPADGPHQKKADRVVAEAIRLEKLTNDLLELVRTGTIQRRRVDPRKPIEAAILAIGSPASSIERHYADDLADRDLDPAQLSIAIENVLRNAVQANGGGNEAAVAVSLKEDGDAALIIEIRDHGPGIPRGEETAIFKPFRTGKAKGTGLGLAIARRIVELHGGIIEASNHPEGGAVFQITIPRDPSSKPRRERAS